jgi:hypothetical protein
MISAGGSTRTSPRRSFLDLRSQLLRRVSECRHTFVETVLCREEIEILGLTMPQAEADESGAAGQEEAAFPTEEC